MYQWGDNRRFNSYKRFLQERFGGRMQKLTLNAGFTCPNRDGSIGVGGCTYCVNEAFNPSYCDVRKSVTQQLDEGIEFHQNRYRRADGYLAYFQAYSNTYASLEKMDELYRPAIEHPLIRGIVVGTRPDCIDDRKLEYFARLQEKMFVSIEYGIESCYDKTLMRINRGHTFRQAVDAIEKTKIILSILCVENGEREIKSFNLFQHDMLDPSFVMFIICLLFGRLNHNSFL